MGFRGAVAAPFLFTLGPLWLWRAAIGAQGEVRIAPARPETATSTSIQKDERKGRVGDSP